MNDLTSEVRILHQLSQNNLQRVDLWFTKMLDLSGLIFTIITILLGISALLIWTHIKQAIKAEKILKEASRLRFEVKESLTYSLTTAPKALKRRGGRLTLEEVKEKALLHRGFAPMLLKTERDNAVFAIDEYGVIHWIPNPATLIRMGYSGSDIQMITKEQLDRSPRGVHIPDLSKQ